MSSARSAVARGPLLFLAWTRVPGRSQEIAHELGGDSRVVAFSWCQAKAFAPIRYLVSLVVTAQCLIRRRPRKVIVSNPPIFPGLLAWAYSRTTGAQVILDSHAGSFGLKGDELSRKLLPVHAWLARRVTGVLVASPSLADMVRQWGGRPIVVHEAPRPVCAGTRTERGRPFVAFVSRFEPDEPVAEVVLAAGNLPEVDFVITGDLRRCPRDLVSLASANVSWAGYLDQADYDRLIADAEVVLALTTEPTSALRVGFDAVYLQRPLVITDFPLLRSLFPDARHVANNARGIAAGLREVLADLPSALATTAPARERQLHRWAGQLAELRQLLELDGPAATRAKGLSSTRPIT
jgi:glycosyltransferase involved in cell wall biosynthesis